MLFCVAALQFYMTDESLLEALYCINKYAKKYAEQASKAYEANQKRWARVYSIKKTALYDYKSHILTQLYEDGVDDVERHEIRGDDFYCFYVDGYSFHTPAEDVEDTVEYDDVSDARDITDEFSSERSVDDLPLSEREALLQLQSVFGSANTFIGQKFVEGYYTSDPVGWQFLSEYTEQGDVTTEKRVEERFGEGFKLAVGDSFDTVEHGWVEIVDRYGVWTDGWLHNGDTVRPRPAYDVQTEEKQYESVQQRELLDDWRVNLHDTQEMAGIKRIQDDEYVTRRVSNVPRLENGDQVRFASDVEPTAATIQHIETNDLCLVFFVLDWDTKDWVDYFAADEFLQDVVTVVRDGEEHSIDWSYDRSTDE